MSTCLRAILLSLLLSTISLSAQPVTVAAASDLTQLERPLSDAFHAQTGLTLRFTFGASGILAQQLRNGAPYDVFLSANYKYINDLVSSGDVDPATVRVYALGRLGLWSPTGAVHSLAQLTDPRIGPISIANPEFAPYGLAARQLLEKEGLWQKLQPRLVLGENVTQALQFAESGNAGAVITSWTLVAPRGGILLPPNHAPIRQTAAVAKSSHNPTQAQQFLQFLTTPPGRAILSRFGLTPP